MSTLNIYVVPMDRVIPVQVDLAHDTPDGVITGMRNSGQIPPPPNTAGGGVTIWKMTKGAKGNGPVGRCLSDLGFIDGEMAYLIAVP